MYEALGNKIQAYTYYKHHIELRDSLINEDSKKIDIKNELNFQFQKQLFADSVEYAKQNEIAFQKIEKEQIKTAAQKKLTYSFSIAFIITLVLSGFIFKEYHAKKKANQIIIEQKNEVEKQSNIISEKNKEITDSITYAKRIQEAILPSRYSLTENLTNGFVLFNPKDIVSGDFYWLEKYNETIYFAAADCTGHGVPGAMVSVVCANALSKTLLEEKITEAGKILDRTRDLVVSRFGKSGEDVKDGMDIALCSLRFDVRGLTSLSSQARLKLNEPNTLAVLEYAGANNPLWIIRPTVIASATKQFVQNEQIASLPTVSRNDGNLKLQTSNFELLEIKGNKQPIGKMDNPQPFTTHTIELQKGDTIYIFTDGFADQFGGKNGKKLMYKPFKELLLSLQDKTMDEQKEILEHHFEKWEGKLEQVDDVCVIGVRI